jgi:hypothetical protein
MPARRGHGRGCRPRVGPPDMMPGYPGAIGEEDDMPGMGGMPDMGGHGGMFPGMGGPGGMMTGTGGPVEYLQV